MAAWQNELRERISANAPIDNTANPPVPSRHTRAFFTVPKICGLDAGDGASELCVLNGVR